MDAQRAVERLLELADQDPELKGLAGTIREYVPIMAAILAPREKLKPGELPYDQVVTLLDRTAQLWEQAKSEAAAPAAGPR